MKATLVVFFTVASFVSTAVNASFAFQYVPGYVDPVEKVTVTFGGKEFSYGKRRSNYRCLFVCEGLTGLNATGK